LKARQEVARVHVHVANQRRDFHHKVARKLVENYGLIAVEDLNCKGLAGSMLANSVHDAGWSQFISILSGKAEYAGRTLVKVNPAGTTQECSRCGCCVPKMLKDRWHLCTACALSISRDLNAAVNILKRAPALIPNQGLGWSLQAITVDRYSSEQVVPSPEKLPALAGGVITELEGQVQPVYEKAGGVSTVSGKTPPLTNPLLHISRPRVERSTRGRVTKLDKPTPGHHAELADRLRGGYRADLRRLWPPSPRTGSFQTIDESWK